MAVVQPVFQYEWAFKLYICHKEYKFVFNYIFCYMHCMHSFKFELEDNVIQKQLDKNSSNYNYMQSKLFKR